jgi:hypothetical protein
MKLKHILKDFINIKIVELHNRHCYLLYSSLIYIK